jgi:hypothetical protein
MEDQTQFDELYDEFDHRRTDVMVSLLALIHITPWWRFRERRFWRKQLIHFVGTKKSL